jgi:hypothetical protein
LVVLVVSRRAYRLRWNQRPRRIGVREVVSRRRFLCVSPVTGTLRRQPSEGVEIVKLNCCVAKKRPFGSGWAWTHAKGCPVDPNQKVRGAELAELHARLAHPAGKGAGYVPGGTPAPETAGRT